jgi:mono/diheme cytochrome c family protein
MNMTGLHIAVLTGFFLVSSSVSSQGLNSATAKRGRILYEKHCASCHQLDGNGVPRLIPPLTGTDFVSGDKSRLIRILLEGLNERIVVQEEEYYSPMASFKHLTDQQIADVLSYIRASFGPKASVVTAPEVGAQRKKLQ